MKIMWIFMIFGSFVGMHFYKKYVSKKTKENQLIQEKQLLEEDAKKEFFEQIKRFHGCFQPLNEAVLENNEKAAVHILKLWKRQMSDTLRLLEWFEQVQKEEINDCQKALRWLEVLTDWGIKYDKKDSIFLITQEEEVLYFYDDIFELGDSAKVLRPCWYYIVDGRKKCIEKGTASLE